MPLVIPDEPRRRRLSEIQKNLAEHKEEGGMPSVSRAVKLMLEESAFRKHVSNNSSLVPPKTEQDLVNYAWAFLYHLLSAKDKFAAALVLWDRETFCCEPMCVQRIWNTLSDHRMVCLIGGGAMSKTYSPSAFFLLEYILDPAWTRFQVASASHDHLISNLFRDVGALHSDASMELPGKQDSQSISIDKRKRQGVFTLTLPGGSNGKSKIKGSHTKPRPLHPLFGRRSRLFCVIDEAQEIPENVFDEIPNRFSSVDGDDVDHLKFSVSANPRDIFSKFGRIVKPRNGGWATITRHTTSWISDKGWAVESLDQTQHENYIARKKIFPGFATYDGVQEILRSCDGDPEDPRMYTLVYGKFPPQGTTFAIIKQRHLLAAEGEWVFAGNSVAIAGMDPAFTSDRPAFAYGRAGLAMAWIDTAGETHPLKEKKMAIQIDDVVVLPRAKGIESDSQDLADEAMSRLKDLGVRPEGFGIDQTGIGRGTADIIRRQWEAKIGPLSDTQMGNGASIWGIEYGEKATTVKIAEEDTQSPRERFDRIATELWYSAAKFFEFDSIRIGKSVDVKVMSELASRAGDMQPGLGHKLTVETKDKYKQRTGGSSPDLADACLILVHVARMSIAGITPRAKDTTAPREEPRSQVWGGFNQSLSGANIHGMAGAGQLADLITD